jgi:TRAP-type C4-dicarboxylate transport system substrate-binding protein
LTGHKYESTPVVAGLGWWSGLDEATQNCAIEATAEAGKIQRDLVLSSDEDLRPVMEAEGAIFAEADKAAYQAATASVYDKYAEKYPQLVAALRTAAGL